MDSCTVNEPRQCSCSNDAKSKHPQCKQYQKCPMCQLHNYLKIAKIVSVVVTFTPRDADKSFQLVWEPSKEGRCNAARNDYLEFVFAIQAWRQLLEKFHFKAVFIKKKCTACRCYYCMVLLQKYCYTVFPKKRRCI